MNGDWGRLLPRPPHRPDWTPLRARLRGRRVLVTGSGGSVGTELVATLAASGIAHLTLVDVHEPSLFHQHQRLMRACPELPVRYVLADVRDQRKMRHVLAEAQPDLLFHLAAYKQVPLAEENVDQVVAVNIFATLGLARLAAQAGVRSFLYPSTDKAVRPPSIYGATKRVVELSLRAMAAECPDLALRVVRLVNVLGSQGSVIDLFARQLAAGQPLTLTDPTMTRYWTTVDEVSYLLAQVACAPDLPFGPFLLDPGPALSMEALARGVVDMLAPGRDVPLRTIGARPGERQHEELAYPFETLEPTGYLGILHAVDARPPAPAGALAERVERLQMLALRGDGAALRQALFALVQEEMVWSPV